MFSIMLSRIAHVPNKTLEFRRNSGLGGTPSKSRQAPLTHARAARPAVMGGASSRGRRFTKTALHSKAKAGLRLRAVACRRHPSDHDSGRLRCCPAVTGRAGRLGFPVAAARPAPPPEKLRSGFFFGILLVLRGDSLNEGVHA